MIDGKDLTEGERRAIQDWDDVIRSTSKPEKYTSGNKWQQDRYAYMAEYNHRLGVTDYAKPRKGEEYFGHLLGLTSTNELHQFLWEQRILDEVHKRINAGKLGDPIRLLTNTVASQPCCFNIFVPLRLNLSLASNLFSRLLGKEVQVKHIEIEFTPYVKETDDRHLEGFPFGGDESLGDQSVRGGTDSDVAVFFTFGNGKRGVILIEFKYIEAEFSVCKSYKEKCGATDEKPKNKNIRPACDSTEYYGLLIAPDIDTIPKPTHPDCGYLKYNNWQLLEQSKVFDENAIRNFGHCPFRYSLQQLWRNMLLAENVARVRKIDEFYFWVIAPKPNTYLWVDRDGNVFEHFNQILTSYGQSRFRCLDLKDDFADALMSFQLAEWQKTWLNRFKDRYLTLQ